MKIEDNCIRVYFVDDDADDRDFFSEALKKAKINASLISFEDGEKLLKQLSLRNGNAPDIIFLDINMPRMDGKECLKIIRSNHEFHQVPVVMFSTSDDLIDIEESFKLGANRYFVKSTFFEEEVRHLQEMFLPEWEKHLLKPDRRKYLII